MALTQSSRRILREASVCLDVYWVLSPMLRVPFRELVVTAKSRSHEKSDASAREHQLPLRHVSTVVPAVTADPRSKRVSLNTVRKEEISLRDGLHEAHIDRDMERRLRNGLFDGLINGQRACLAEAITCVESTWVNRPWSKKWKGRKLVEWSLEQLKRREGESGTLRIGISGAPGAGKSTFLEALGSYLTSDLLTHKLACLTVDPSSRITGGSLLGDKTRMPNLSRNPRAFIRPSPSSGAVGGVTRSTSEAILLCEAAGYDLVFVETVGSGQNEFVVADMVDIFVVLISPGTGDELQAVKRGIMEMCDLVVVNKADGDLKAAARRTQAEYVSALKFMPARSSLSTTFDWQPKVVRVSSVTNEGIESCWEAVLSYKRAAVDSGFLAEKRRHQNVQRMWRFVQDELQSLFHSSQPEQIAGAERAVLEGSMTASMASERLLSSYRNFLCSRSLSNDGIQVS